ncbi:MAG TPA: MFS transporter [Reyranella sp.]|nr:MFS transporter [Reyranella sp.]
MAISRGVERVASTAPGSAVRVAVLCGLVQMLDGYDLSAVGLAAPALIKAWGVTPVSLTSAFAFSSIGIMVGAMLAGPIADRFGRKPVLLASVAMFGLFSLLTVWAHSIGLLVAMRFFTGIGIGGAMPTTVALTSDYTSDRWRTSAVMFMFTGNTIGGFFAGQIAAQILPSWGWQGIFLVGGVVPLVLLVVLGVVLPESPQFHPGRQAVSRESPVAGLFRDGMGSITLLLWAIFLINLLNMYLISYWLPTTLTLGGMKPAEAAFAASLYSAGAIVSTLAFGPAIARLGAVRVLAASFTIGAICIGIVGGVPLSPGWTLVVLALAGAGFVGSQLGLNGYAAALYPPEVRSTGIGWALGVGRLGGIVGPVIGGALLATGLPPRNVLMFACAPALVTAILVLVLGYIYGRHVGQRTSAVAKSFD